MLPGTDYPYENMKACIDFFDSQEWADTDKEHMYDGSAALSLR
jgi:hypothetical protein